MNDMIYPVLITVMFLISGIRKFMEFSSTVNGFVIKTGATQTVAQILILAAAVLQVASAAIIMYKAYKGEKDDIARKACYALALFTVAATGVYHFPPTGKTFYPFISNVTTVGALLLLADKYFTA